MTQPANLACCTRAQSSFRGGHPRCRDQPRDLRSTRAEGSYRLPEVHVLPSFQPSLETEPEPDPTGRPNFDHRPRVRSRDQEKGPVICAQIRYSALTNHGIPAISNERVIGDLRDFELLSRRFSLLCIVLSALGRRAGRCGGRGPRRVRSVVFEGVRVDRRDFGADGSAGALRSAGNRHPAGTRASLPAGRMPGSAGRPVRRDATLTARARSEASARGRWLAPCRAGLKRQPRPAGAGINP